MRLSRVSTGFAGEYTWLTATVVSRAFQILSDAEKKSRYDQFGGDPDNRFSSSGAGAAGASPFSGFARSPGRGPFYEDEISPEELFNRFFGGGMAPGFGFGGKLSCTSWPIERTDEIRSWWFRWTAIRLQHGRRTGLYSPSYGRYNTPTKAQRGQRRSSPEWPVRINTTSTAPPLIHPTFAFVLFFRLKRLNTSSPL